MTCAHILMWRLRSDFMAKCLPQWTQLYRSCAPRIEGESSRG
jgi:hypothetical protein